MELSERPSAPGNDTSTRSNEFLPPINAFPRALMVSWNTSTKVRESTEPFGTSLTADSGTAKPQSLEPADMCSGYNLDNEPHY